jgi:hypothetical protein
MGHYRVYLKVTVGLLARISGKSVYTVRRHIKKGIFDPGDWESIHEWLLRYGKVDKEKGGSG